MTLSLVEFIDLLATIAAHAVNGVQHKSERRTTSRPVHADHLASALGLNMTKCFTPTAETYFNRVSKAHILTVIDEAKSSHAPSLKKLKKSELPARAEALVTGSGWFPEPLRSAIDDDAADAYDQLRSRVHLAPAAAPAPGVIQVSYAPVSNLAGASCSAISAWPSLQTSDVVRWWAQNSANLGSYILAS